MASIRTFIAIVLPPAVRQTLARYQQQLGAPGAPYVKWVDPEGIHLTLKFLGNVDEGRMTELAQALARAVAGKPAFFLQTGAPGAFPNVRNPRVLWVGLEGEVGSLQGLFQSVEASLVSLGFPRESRPFAPHLTLGRMRETASRVNRGQLARSLEDLGLQQPLTFVVKNVCLMRSHLAPTGATYTTLNSVQLGT